MGIPAARGAAGAGRISIKEENDMLHRASTEGKSWLMELEAGERESSGIKNLKINVELCGNTFCDGKIF